MTGFGCSSNLKTEIYDNSREYQESHIKEVSAFLGAAANVGVTEIKFTFTASVGYKKASKIMSDGKSGMSIAVA